MNNWIFLGIRRPWLVIISGLLLMFACASGLKLLHKDTRADAFLEQDNPALVYKNRVQEVFGLSDPLIVAVYDPSAEGIYRLPTLTLVKQLTDELNQLPTVNAALTLSLASENNIVGSADGLDVAPFYDLLNSGTPADVRRAIEQFPLYHGMLVSDDGQMTIIALEMYHDDQAEQTYNAVAGIVNNTALPAGVTLYVAGEGAVLGFLGQYIDHDASRLNPLAGLIITVMLIIAFRRLAPALLGNLIIAASVLMTLGIMSYAGVPFFVITNAMPVILIGMAVADSIHIFSHYYELQASHPQWTLRQCAEESVRVMARPVTLTSLTTVAGFLGLYASSYMPPFEYFGLFTSLGVVVAWYYSLFVLPAFLTLLKPRVSKRWIALEQSSRHDLFATLMQKTGNLALQRPPLTITVFAVIALAGALLTTQIKVDENRINTFHPDEPISQADKVVNEHLDGTNTLNIIVRTPEKEGIFVPQVLQAIEDLQRYAETLPHVNGSVSVVDYLKQMNKSLNEDRADAYVLPANAEAVAQYFLLYSSSGDPDDFDEEIDYDYRLANIRLNLDNAAYSETRPVIEALQNYIDTHFNSAAASANLSGRVHVNYHWIKELGRSHAVSVGISLLCVMLVSALLFRSFSAGVLAALPVVFSILTVYAAMALLHIDLGIGTSMFASVAIGLGIDFAIHTLERLKALVADGLRDDELYQALFRSTGRALLFNYLAIAFGFGVLITSKVVPLTNFGTIVVLSVSMSFIASLTLLPALVKRLRPAFIFGDEQAIPSVSANSALLQIALPVSIALLTLLHHAPVQADERNTLDALTIAQKVNAVDEGQQASSLLQMTLTDNRGKERQRTTQTFRKYYGDDKKTLFFFNAPANVKGTGFLTFDYEAMEQEDDQWLYLPAVRKARRISASDRGDYFMGTDFTYEDIKQNGRISLHDYTLSRLPDDGFYLRLRAEPKSTEIAQELGYGEVIFTINPDNWLVIKSDYRDPKGVALKTTEISDIRMVDGIWTRHRLLCKNHISGHQSLFVFSGVDYRNTLNDNLFTQQSLRRGL
ncbi:outer membrane lipoprotein-sorting protein [Thalassolituus sp. LLYu03]|uniref:outer membrane lipoprotein-sorting protein n=1 Tax=Thalassolituus sp. LLYu03 TaxID=3421656 RepID=UPI003D296ED2